MQYGPSLAAFREIGEQHTEGVLYSTVVAALQDEIGNAFGKRYKDRFGDNASHLVGALPYDGCHMWAIAAALAGGTGEPGNFEQNQKVADRLRNLIYRGTDRVPARGVRASRSTRLPAGRAGLVRLPLRAA